MRFRRATPDPEAEESGEPRVESPEELDVCGYRLVRVLERTSTSTTWLAAVQRQLDTHLEKRTIQSRGPVALTRFNSTDAACALPAAMFVVSSPHLQTAVDIATDASHRTVIITERIEHTLEELLDSRECIEIGEAVTVLAPLASALATLHGAGFAHGGVGPSEVGFTGDGRPLLSLTRPRSEGVGPSGTQTELVHRDLSDLGALMAQVFEHSAGPDDDAPSALQRWFSRAMADADGMATLAQLDLRLFALAAPKPIHFQREGAEQARPENSAALLPERHRRLTRELNSAPVRGVTWLSQLLDGAGLGSVAEIADSLSVTQALANRFRGLGGWVSRALRRRATLMVVATGVAVAVVWAGLSVLPESRTEARQDSAQSTMPTHPHTAPVGFTEAERAAVQADDAQAALTALLAVRARCLAAGNLGCVAVFDEDGSAAQATDEHAIRAGGEGPLSGSIDHVQVEPVQRTGDAALFRVTGSTDKESQPVLVLVMKTSAGWRVRDLAVPG